PNHLRRAKIPGGDAHPNRNARQNHQCKIGCRTRQRHPGRTARVLALPVGIKWRVRPADHPAAQGERHNRDDDHPERGPAYVRNGVERHLAALGRGKVAAHFRDERVRRFMARRRKQKDDVPDGAEREVRSVHRRDSRKSIGSGAWTRTRITSSKGWRATDCTTPEWWEKCTRNIVIYSCRWTMDSNFPRV